MIDLTIRFIPTLAAEFAETIDAQRVRGYDPTARKGGPISRLRRMAPIFVPVTVGSIAGAEDTIDAMDLRAFGVGQTHMASPAPFRTSPTGSSWPPSSHSPSPPWPSALTGNSQHYLFPFLIGE